MNKILEAAKTQNIWAKLINHEEVQHLEHMTSFVHQEKGLKMRWLIDDDLTNVHPFTYIIVGAGKKALEVYAIRPLFAQTGTEIELTVL